MADGRLLNVHSANLLDSTHPLNRMLLVDDVPVG